MAIPDQAAGATAAPMPARRKSPTRNAPEIVLDHPIGSMFLMGDVNRTQDQHLGKLVMTPERIAQWQQLMRDRAGWAREHGIEFLFMLGPDKQSVYWPRMGTGTPDHRNSLLVFRDLDDVPWVDPTGVLAAAPESPPVYPFNDSHYDARGAFIAYCELMRHSDRHRDQILREGEHFDYITVESAGDLGNKFVPHRKGPFLRLKRKKMYSRLVYVNGVTGNGGFRVHLNPRAEGIGLLCGDSYSQNIVAFIAEHFHVLVHLRSPIDRAFAESIQPQTVIGMVAERFMLQPPVMPDDVPAELMFIRKLARKEMEREELVKSRVELAPGITLPEAVLQGVQRHDALADDLLAPGVDTERQSFFISPLARPVTAADAVVAGHLAISKGRSLPAGWDQAFAALPESTRSHFQQMCGRLPDH